MTTPEFQPVDVIRIQQLLPHRYPFLLVDRVIELEPNLRIKAIKNVTINEPFFQAISLATRSCRACWWSRPWRRPAAC